MRSTLIRLLVKILSPVAILFFGAVLIDLIYPPVHYSRTPQNINIKSFKEETITLTHVPEFSFSVLRNEISKKNKGTLLFLHGFPDNHLSWTSQLEHFDKLGYFVISPSIRGYGGRTSQNSTFESGYVWISSLVVDVISILDYYQIREGDNVFLVGHDWGSLIASSTASKYPSRFNKLVLISVPPAKYVSLPFSCFLSSTQLFTSWYMLFFQLPILPEISIQYFSLVDTLWYLWRGNVYDCVTSGSDKEYDHFFGKISTFFSKLIYNNECQENFVQISDRYSNERLSSVINTLSAPFVTSYALDYYRSNIPLLLLGETFIPLYSKTNQKHARETLELISKTIETPTLYVMGELDGCINTKTAKCSITDEQFPKGIEMKFIPKAGHFIQHDTPEILNSILENWVCK